MNKSITFATGNSRKIAEATATLTKYNIGVVPVKVTIDEIQHHDPAEITKAKARAAFDVIKKPVVVSDTSWRIPALGGFPGGYMKDVATWLQPNDWLSLMKDHADKTIICLEHVAYCDGNEVRHFEYEYQGKFIDEERGRDDESESFEKVVILYGTKTMAEQLQDGEIASASEELEHWNLFGKWYQKS